MNLRTKVSVVILVTATAATTAFPALSGASPVDDKRRQAAELQRQIDANDNELVMLSEQLNGATLRETQATEGIQEAQRRTDVAEGQQRHVRSMLSQRAAQMYKGAGSASPLAQMDVKSIGEISTRSHYAAAAADRDDTLVAKLQKAEEALAVRRTDLERQRGAAQAEKQAASAAKSKIDDANRKAAALQQQVKGEIGTILKQEADAKAAAAQREAQRRAAAPPQRITTGGGDSRNTPIPPNFPDAPAPNAGAAAAVAFARAQVGKQYVYATSGPDTYDCSGLTARAWQEGGVSLAHYSGAQYQETMRIGSGDLQPGDLIFYGPGGSDHVEIYIGGGMAVSASNPSSGVKYSPVRYGSASGYGRVRA